VRHAFKPDGTERARVRDKKRAGAGGGAREYWCRACNTRVASEDDAIDPGSADPLRFVNPAGVVFEIACFHHARCRVEGEPTLEATWFAGFAWSYAHCANCGAHLGWLYEREGGRFFGLILACLVGPV
jgi:hypothetical protein